MALLSRPNIGVLSHKNGSGKFWLIKRKDFLSFKWWRHTQSVKKMRLGWLGQNVIKILNTICEEITAYHLFMHWLIIVFISRVRCSNFVARYSQSACHACKTKSAFSVRFKWTINHDNAPDTLRGGGIINLGIKRVKVNATLRHYSGAEA